jgi:hypothetical protein
LKADLKSQVAAQLQSAGIEDRHLQSQIEQSVAEHLQHLTTRIVAPDAASAAAGQQQPATPGASLRQMLRNPNNVRQAVLLNEILSRPRIPRSRN